MLSGKSLVVRITTWVAPEDFGSDNVVFASEAQLLLELFESPAHGQFGLTGAVHLCSVKEVDTGFEAKFHRSFLHLVSLLRQVSDPVSVGNHRNFHACAAHVSVGHLVL